MRKTLTAVALAGILLAGCAPEGEPQGEVKHSIRPEEAGKANGKPPVRAVKTWNSLEDSDRVLVCQVHAEGGMDDVLAMGVASNGDVNLAMQWAAVLPRVCPSP